MFRRNWDSLGVLGNGVLPCRCWLLLGLLGRGRGQNGAVEGLACGFGIDFGKVSLQVRDKLDGLAVFIIALELVVFESVPDEAWPCNLLEEWKTFNRVVGRPSAARCLARGAGEEVTSGHLLGIEGFAEFDLLLRFGLFGGRRRPPPFAASAPLRPARH